MFDYTYITFICMSHPYRPEHVGGLRAPSCLVHDAIFFDLVYCRHDAQNLASRHDGGRAALTGEPPSTPPGQNS